MSELAGGNEADAQRTHVKSSLDHRGLFDDDDSDADLMCPGTRIRTVFSKLVGR